MSVQTMAIVAGVILAVLAVVPFVVAILPARQPDPQRGMAVGCLLMFSLATLVPAGLLAWGHFGGHPTLVRTIFWILAVAVAYGAVMGVVTIVQYRKQRRWR